MTAARSMHNTRPLIERCPDNPILTRDDIPYPVETVYCTPWDIHGLPRLEWHFLPAHGPRLSGCIPEYP